MVSILTAVISPPIIIQDGANSPAYIYKLQMIAAKSLESLYCKIMCSLQIYV